MSVRPCANRSTGKEVNMRNRFDRQLVQLNNELIEMGGMIEKAISDTVKALEMCIRDSHIARMRKLRSSRQHRAE